VGASARALRCATILPRCTLLDAHGVTATALL
jgi:hypothetical protein